MSTPAYTPFDFTVNAETNDKLHVHFWELGNNEHALCGSTEQHHECRAYDQVNVNGFPLCDPVRGCHRCGAPLCPYCKLLLSTKEEAA